MGPLTCWVCRVYPRQDIFIYIRLERYHMRFGTWLTNDPIRGVVGRRQWFCTLPTNSANRNPHIMFPLDVVNA